MSINPNLVYSNYAATLPEDYRSRFENTPTAAPSTPESKIDISDILNKFAIFGQSILMLGLGLAIPAGVAYYVSSRK